MKSNPHAPAEQRRPDWGRLVWAVTSPASLPFIALQLQAWRAAGFEVTLLVGEGPAAAIVHGEGIRVEIVAWAREISPVRDLRCLWRAWRILRRLKPRLLLYGSPKASLLVGVAAWLARVPCRIYHLWGLRCETATGLSRRVLWAAEWVTCHASHDIIAVSPSLRETILQLGLAEADRVQVLGMGSTHGVDADRFAPTAAAQAQARQWRTQAQLPAGALVAGFVGRIAPDKGIEVLLDSCARLRATWPQLWVLVIGPLETTGDHAVRLAAELRATPQVLWLEGVYDPVPFFQVIDVLVLPTFREGMPNVVLEAQAAGKPVITTLATGARDAVVPNVSGLLVPPGDAAKLAEALALLLGNPTEARAMGQRGREWVIRHFDPSQVTAQLVEECCRILQLRERRWVAPSKSGTTEEGR